MSDAQTVPTPKHLWVVGIVMALWNAMGAFDYTMTQTQNEAYMGQFTPEQLEVLLQFPGVGRCAVGHRRVGVVWPRRFCC